MPAEPAAVSLDTIRAAAGRISDVIYQSPCPYSLSLSRLCGSEIYCKLDHLQITGSFKERGARNKLKLMLESRAANPPPAVVAASAGNHALALAYHGQDLGVPVTVVMPKWAPLVKVSNCRSFGANVILHGESFDEARTRATVLAEEKGLAYVSGFDDAAIIAGQGTMGLEILRDVPDADAVIVPVGGAGLIAGVGTAVKALRPQCRIIGVEPRHAPTLYESLKNGRPTKIPVQTTIADGLAVAEVGRLCFDLIRQNHLIDDLLLVDEPQIDQSILKLLELEKTVVEGAGAVPLAAAMMKRPDLAGKKVVLCLCGGNIDVTLIARVIERGLAADGRLTRVTAFIPDRPGSLAGLLSTLAATGASIKEVFHDRNFGPADVTRVAVSVVMETRDFAHVKEVHEALKSAGIDFSPGNGDGGRVTSSPPA
jgi:threonine dehydratase